MDKRGVYFFVIDAFIGGAIVVLGLFMVLNSYASSQPNKQPLVILEDMVAYFQNTEVRDFQGNYTQSLVEKGNITNPQNTLFEQVAYFDYFNQTNLSRNMVEEVVNSSLPSQFSIRYYYDNKKIYDESNFPYNQSGVVLSSRKIAMVGINATEMHGPHIVEVIVWTS